MTEPIIMEGVREYGEGMPVELIMDGKYPAKDRLCIQARNEAGYNGTAVDLMDMLQWLKANRPELLR